MPLARAFDAARAQPHDAVAARGERRVVGDQHQRGAALRVAGEQQIDDLLAGGLVEIAGRLVGDQDRRIGRQRAGQRDALLLAAGQLRRIVRAAVRPSPTAASSRARALERVGGAGQFQRHRDVFQRRHGRDQVEGLEHDADIAAAEARQRVLVERAEILAGDRHRPVSARSSPAITISSVDLPEPDGPTRPIASPRPIFRSMSLRIWTRAAPARARD